MVGFSNEKPTLLNPARKESYKWFQFTFPGIPQPVKLDLNKKSFPKQKTIQNFTIDAQGFRKTKNENPPTWEMGVTS